MAQPEDVIRKATRIAHQAALDDHLRIKTNLAKVGITVDDLFIMERYPLADFKSAREHDID